MSPDGSRIIWASSRDVAVEREYFVPFLDYWIMDPDGSNPRRLTHFNDPDAPEYFEDGVVTADFAFSGDGMRLARRLELSMPGVGLPRDVFEGIVVITLK
jgi:hypothetical protein